MPFDDEDQSDLVKKVELKKVSSQKSMFDKPDKPKVSQQTLEQRADEINKKNNDYKSRAAELAVSFKKILLDKTLPQNKSIFLEEIEKETLSKMIALAVEINADEDEDEGMGTLGWVTLMLKYFLHHRDRINSLEYELKVANKNIDSLKKELEKIKEFSGLDAKPSGA